MEYLHQALSCVRQKTHEKASSVYSVDGSKEEIKLSCNKEERQKRANDGQKDEHLCTDDLVNCMASPDIIDLLTEQMLMNFGILQTSKLQFLPGEEVCSEDKRPSPSSTECDKGSGLHEPSNEWEIEKHLPCKRKCTHK